MKHFKVIEQLSFNKQGELICKKPSGRSYQKAHYKQGDLDGACGAYSLSMVLNILGVFEADDLYKDTKEHDKRTVEWKLIKALNEWGLYPDGLDAEDIIDIIITNYSKYVVIESINEKESILDKIKNCIEDNVPIVQRIEFKDGGGHWIVVVGYAENEKKNVTHLLTLDPGSNPPRYSLWNGILNLQKEYRKKYGYHYYSDEDRMVSVSMEDAIIIRKK